MIELDFETEQTTLKLRDAFRVLIWQTGVSTHLKKTELSDCYTRFMSRWRRSSIRSMDLTQLTALATEKGFGVEGLLIFRQNYYGLGKLPEFDCDSSSSS